jgi:hypothetical protein
MYKIKMFFKLMVMILAFAGFFASCASSPPPQQQRDPAADAERAAREALAAMDGGGTTAPISGAPSAAGGAGAAQTPSPTGARPGWVDNPEMVYSRARFISAVGHASTRNNAERDALARLTGVFGQSVQAELRTTTAYSEAVRDGVIQVSENTAVQNAIVTSAQMDTLVGAEIADTWNDTQNRMFYAVAVMERERTSILYSDLIRSNERIIASLVDMPAATRNSLDGYARYTLAATIADANRLYANVLTVVGNTRGINPAQMQSGDSFRLQAADIAANIPMGVAVEGDRGNRLSTAISRAVTATGFRAGGANSRYMLRFSYTVDTVDLPGQTNQFVRYELVGTLQDTAGGNAVLLPFSARGREGHLTRAEAEERAFRSAERDIAGDFGNALKSYLDNLVSVR